MNCKRIFLLSFLIITLFSSYCFASDITVQCPSVVLIHADTGKILYEKEAYKPMYPASTTKIMTAILVLENAELTDIATVSYDAVMSVPVGYSHANLQIGEQFTIEQLLHVLLIPSANDAANVLAEYVGGSIAEFADMMNQKATEIGCQNTHFVNPSGIHNNDHYSTAYDLALMGQYAMKNDTFRSIVCKTSFSLPATNQYSSDDRVFITTNDLLRINTSSKPDNYYYPYAIGIKTGFTTPARNCLVAQSSRDGLDFIVTVLGGTQNTSGISQRYSDTIQLFNYAYENYTIKKVKNASSLVKSIEIKDATQSTKDLNLLIKDEISVLIPKQDIDKTILPQITLKENLEAPIAQGEVVGHIQYIIEDIVYESDLLAETAVEKENILFIFLKILLIAFLLFVIYKLIVRTKGKKSRKKKYIQYYKY